MDSMVTNKKNLPKLRRNRRLENRWGYQYYTAVKNAVFMLQLPRYVPPEPPSSLIDPVLNCRALYECAQCKDCFYLRSSLEDHYRRKSWILGYWCQQCFISVCTHKSSTCAKCARLEQRKHAYLHSRGLINSQKSGVIRLFYNQCQFFAHLKTHDINAVDIADLMLMPLPADMEPNWGTEVDLVCEALMEHTFLHKVHIMDWLKAKEIDKNWWQLSTGKVKDSFNPIHCIIKNYKARRYFKPLQIPVTQQFSILTFTKCGSNNECKLYNVDNTNSPGKIDTTICNSDDSVIENEDNPCTDYDIAFVDCGSAPKRIQVKSTTNNNFKGSTVTFARTNDNFYHPSNKLKKFEISHSNSISPDIVMSYGNTLITPKPMIESSFINMHTDTDDHLLRLESSSVVQSDVVCSTTKADMKLNKPDKLKPNVHTLTVNSGHKVLTIQSMKHIDINGILKQLPSHIVKGRKIIFKGPDSNPIVHNAQESSSQTSSETVSGARLETSTGVSKSTTTSLHISDKPANKPSNKPSKKASSNNQTGTVKNKSRNSFSKVIHHNGRRYIIKQTTGGIKNLKGGSKVSSSKKQKAGQSKSAAIIPPLIPLDSTNIDSAQIKEKINSIQADISPLTPSPSPSELSSSSSCDTQSKPISPTSKGACEIDSSRLTAGDINGQPCENFLFHKGKDDNLYLNVKISQEKPVCTIIDSISAIKRCRQEMMNEFFHLSYAELKKRFDHVQDMEDEITATMPTLTDDALQESLKAINLLRHVLKYCISQCKEKVEYVEENDTLLNNWESEYEGTSEKQLCLTCQKVKKPTTYIPGFSKFPEHDIYCSCYKYICSKCQTYQGNWSRFVAHQTFHVKRKPYMCPDCFRRFNEFTQLEIHTWTNCFHTLKKRILGCKICEVDGFPDLESIARHFAIMHFQTKMACNKCYIVLPSYSEFKKHYKDKHVESDNPHPIRLILCKLGSRCILRWEDYMLHMEKHTVVHRLIVFKCPFCSFADLESKQTMSHIRNEHLLFLKDIISPYVLCRVLDTETLANLMNLTSNTADQIKREPEICEDGTIVPKIVNARTIPSEVFERGTQEIDDYSMNLNDSDSATDDNKTLLKILDVRSMAGQNTPIDVLRKEKIKEYEELKEANIQKTDIKKEEESPAITIKKEPEAVDQRASMGIKNEIPFDDDLKMKMEIERLQELRIATPPPLTKIPRHMQRNRFKEFRSSVKTENEKKKMRLQALRKQKPRSQRPQRLALNSQMNLKEEALNFSCYLCGELINTTWSVISSHFRTKHYKECKLSIATVKLLRLDPEFINGGYKQILPNRKRRLDQSISNSKRRRRWTPKKHSEAKSSNFPGLGLCVQQETAQDSEGNFRCRKCDERCTDMASLREHIATSHRIKGRYLICLECGENFVVAPSLQMHLKAFHGIQDPITYMAKNTMYAPNDVDELDREGKAIEANQCHVCMAVFEDKAAVDKHLRVHGMAFLNRKRIEAQNALRSPEKKSDTEEKRDIFRTPTKESVAKDKPAESILQKIIATI